MQRHPTQKDSRNGNFFSLIYNFSLGDIQGVLFLQPLPFDLDDV